MLTIDVMLPFYGDVNYFKQAVNSVLAQSYTSWRLVIIDDCYPEEGHRHWINEIISKDSRVSYIRNETNLGVNGNFKKALSLVEADYFVMMGSDDLMRENYLDVVIRNIKLYPGASVIQPGVLTIDKKGNVFKPLPDIVKSWYAPKNDKVRTLSGQEMATSLARADWAYFPSLAWKAKDIKNIGFREGFDIVLDLALLLDLAAIGSTMVVDPEISFLYRRHITSVSMANAWEGSRFDEERDFFNAEAKRFTALGWTKTSIAARNHTASRLNALLLLLLSIVHGKFDSLRPLLQHVIH